MKGWPAVKVGSGATLPCPWGWVFVGIHRGHPWAPLAQVAGGGCVIVAVARLKWAFARLRAMSSTAYAGGLSNKKSNCRARSPLAGAKILIKKNLFDNK